MAIRPTWQGHLRLSLVSCHVALYTGVAASARRPRPGVRLPPMDANR
jgi:hypothetical protein